MKTLKKRTQELVGGGIAGGVDGWVHNIYNTPIIFLLRFSEGTSADREIQRTLMELLNQMDGFDVLGKV